MKTLAVVLSTLFFVQSAFGLVTVGQKQYARAPFCLTKEDAEAIARKDSAEGPEEAFAVFKANTNCGIGEAEIFVKSVTLSLPVKRGGKVSVLEVQVEMADGSKQTVYILTDGEVQGLTKT